MKVVIFQGEENVCVMSVTPDFDLEETAKKDVPEGVEYFIVDSDSLPPEPQETWVLNAGVVTVNAELLKEYHIDTADAFRSSLAATAALKIAPLQDAVDLDEATDDEVALLKKWKQYRVALNRIDLSTAPDITWTESPSN